MNINLKENKMGNKWLLKLYIVGILLSIFAVIICYMYENYFFVYINSICVGYYLRGFKKI